MNSSIIHFYQTLIGIPRYVYRLNQYVSTWSSPMFSNLFLTGAKISTNRSAPTDLHITTGASKTLELDTAVFQDINLDINPRNTGGGRPTFTNFYGNISQYRFIIGDFTDFGACELLHGWLEGSAIEIHVHWALSSANNATVRGVKWQLEYSYSPVGGQFIVPDVQSNETVVPANELAYTSKYTSIFSFSPNVKIGSQVIMQIKRIASVTNPAPASDPFLLCLGIHYQVNTCGSRTRMLK